MATLIHNDVRNLPLYMSKSFGTQLAEEVSFEFWSEDVSGTGNALGYFSDGVVRNLVIHGSFPPPEGSEPYFQYSLDTPVSLISFDFGEPLSIGIIYEADEMTFGEILGSSSFEDLFGDARRVVDGTIEGDILLGGQKDDVLNGREGRDEISGSGGNDVLDGGAGDDTMLGGAGDDIYHVDTAGDQTAEVADEGIDTVRSHISWMLADNVERLELLGSGNLAGTGNTLANTLVGNVGSNALNGHSGNDYMVGGAGNDIYIVAAAGDNTIEQAGQGTDTVRSYINWTLGANIERLELRGSGNINGTGNSLNNTLVGNSGNNSLSGGNGNDYIAAGAGNDTLNGGAGNDRLIGGAGSDNLNGGTGIDIFDFDLVSDSPAGPALRDSVVGGFSHGFDRIDLSTIDANALVAGNQAFSFIGAAAFSGVAGQLRHTNYSGNVIISDRNSRVSSESSAMRCGASSVMPCSP
jgi:Ca2+-binding RTX toxin-like protein